jgi:hypothetical protein
MDFKRAKAWRDEGGYATAKISLPANEQTREWRRLILFRL